MCSDSGIIMVGVIVGSKKTGINPDNVATPIAASFGDLITLAILAWISQGLYNCLGKRGPGWERFIPYMCAGKRAPFQIVFGCERLKLLTVALRVC